MERGARIIMDVGSTMAAIAFADQCLKYGNKFVSRCKTYLRAEDEAKELLISIESNWIKMETQMEILKKVAPNLDTRLQDRQSRVLSQLEGKLKTASYIIEQFKPDRFSRPKGTKFKQGDWKHDAGDLEKLTGAFTQMKPLTKSKFSVKKDSLLAIVDEIEKWQARYDPSWILIMQMAVGGIDEDHEALQKTEEEPESEKVPIIVAAKGLRDAARANQDSELKEQKSIRIEPDDIELNIQKIRNSSVQLSLGPDKSMVLVDTMACNPAANIAKTTKEVRNLARVLAEVDPKTFGLLKCRGVMRVPKPGSVHQLLDFRFIFDVPHKLTNPQSLRAVLLFEKPYPLDERLELAKRLTASVLFVHTGQFVHKNIRPETIIIFQNEYSEIGAPFLSGFEQFRLEDGATFLSADDLWHHNLYRHPSPQGTQPEIEYVMQHDIYSLGVVLLEIGLWTSFAFEDSESDSNSPTPSKILDAVKLESPHPATAAVHKKLRLEYLATYELPPRLGRRYADIVLLCLRCLDPENGMGVDEKSSGAWTDQDGVVIGVRFVEEVLTKIQEIRL